MLLLTDLRTSNKSTAIHLPWSANRYVGHWSWGQGWKFWLLTGHTLAWESVASLGQVLASLGQVLASLGQVLLRKNFLLGHPSVHGTNIWFSPGGVTSDSYLYHQEILLLVSI